MRQRYVLHERNVSGLRWLRPALLHFRLCLRQQHLLGARVLQWRLPALRQPWSKLLSFRIIERQLLQLEFLGGMSQQYVSKLRRRLGTLLPGSQL
jgi:hypothetical protein